MEGLAVHCCADCALHLQGWSGKHWRGPNPPCIMEHPPLCSVNQRLLIIWTVFMPAAALSCEEKFTDFGSSINKYLLSTLAFQLKLTSLWTTSTGGRKEGEQASTIYSLLLGRVSCFHLFLVSFQTEHLKIKILTLFLCSKTLFTHQSPWSPLGDRVCPRLCLVSTSLTSLNLDHCLLSCHQSETTCYWPNISIIGNLLLTRQFYSLLSRLMFL